MTPGWATPESRFDRSSAARRLWSVCLMGLVLVNSSCSLVANATRNLVYETTLCADNVRTGVRHRKLANAAWQEACKKNPVSPVDRLPTALSDVPQVNVMFQPHTGESVYAPAPNQAVRER